MGEQVEIRAAVESVTFRNEKNGWTVLTLRSGKKRIAAVGSILPVSPGENVRITGEMVEHPDYGKQIRISSCEIVAPDTESDIEAYLASGAIKGIGPATASVIVKKLGKDALRILDSDPTCLYDIKGIGHKRADAIIESYRENMSSRMTLMFLTKNGFSPKMSQKLIEAYGNSVQSVITQNPYRLVREIEGIGFQTADRIAMAQGISHESPFRALSAVSYLLQEASLAEGHAYLPADTLRDRARRLLEVDDAVIENALGRLAVDREIVPEEIDDVTAVFPEMMYDAEKDVAYRLMCLLKSVKRAKTRDITRSIDRFEKENGITLSPQQRLAVTAAVEKGVCVITGGPGTGKTTIIKCILSLLQGNGEIALCAPTGRAAKRMSDSTGTEAKTIHRLLEVEEGSFHYNKDNPLLVGTVICDETSMVDLLLMRSLLSALREGTRLVLVGDADQLPSVGPGSVLRDILASGVIPSVCLTEIYRQSEDSMIVLNAHRINSGEMPELNHTGGDFYIQRCDSPWQAAKVVTELAVTRLPKYTGEDPLSGIQVLSPTKKGETGVWALNQQLQEAFNPAAPGKREYRSGDTVYRVGDKVMHIKNNYELEWTCDGERGKGVFNGDMGRIADIGSEGMTVLFDDGRKCVYSSEAMSELELSYCISVHKSQGSEYPVVILPVMPAPKMLMARNLLYTAVTRARRFVMLVGRDAVIAEMIANVRESERYTALARRLRALGNGADSGIQTRFDEEAEEETPAKTQPEEDRQTSPTEEAQDFIDDEELFPAKSAATERKAKPARKSGTRRRTGR